MNTIAKLFLPIILLSPFYKVYASDSTILKREKVIGVYKNERELLHMNTDGFYLERIRPSFQNDVVVPECDSIIAQGKWLLVSNGTIKLSNDSSFERISFNIKQERRLSDDTIYVEVRIPHDESFFEGKFRYVLFFLNGLGNYQTTKSIITIPKRNGSFSKSFNFALSINNLSPNCELGRKCYQRISFKIFEDFNVTNDSNYFTITIPGFNQCFVDRLDVQNDFIYFNGKNSIFWRGKEYKRVNENSSR